MEGEGSRRVDSHTATVSDPARPPSASADRIRTRVFDGIFRCYAVVLAVFVVVAETEWEVVMKFWKVYSSSGVLGRQGNATDICCSDDQSLSRVFEEPSRAFPSSEHRKLPAPCMWCSLCYIKGTSVKGVLCIGAVKRARQKKELSREQAIKDLEESNMYADHTPTSYGRDVVSVKTLSLVHSKILSDIYKEAYDSKKQMILVEAEGII
ncbi:hypothetical protein OROGR_009692 [Orobanche gracilis]